MENLVATFWVIVIILLIVGVIAGAAYGDIVDILVLIIAAIYLLGKLFSNNNK